MPKFRPLGISKIQKTFLTSNKWLSGFVGGRGSGKTKIATIRISGQARPGEPWMAVSPDNNMIRETTLPTFLETVQYTGQYLDHVVSPTPKVWFRSRNVGNMKSKAPCSLVFKGAEKPDKLRGPSKAGIWFDEASIICEEAFQYGIGVCRYKGVMGPCLATFTPRGFKHWSFSAFYERVDESDLRRQDGHQQSLDGIEWFQGRPYRAKPDTFLVRCSTRENPFAPPEYVGRIAQNYSSTLALQELEGDFVEISGLIFKREWFSETVADVPANAIRVRYWDKAASANDGCFTVGLLMARDKRGIYYIEDIVRGQWSPHVRNQIMLQTAAKDASKYDHSVLTYIEQEGGGDGKTVSDQLITMLSEFPVYRDVVSGARWKMKGNVRLPHDAKVRRALPFAAQAEAGNVRLVDGAWDAGDYLDELMMFPEYAYADQVDASSGAFNCLQRVAFDYDLTAQRNTVAVDSSRWGESTELQGDTIEQWEQLPWNQDTEPLGGARF